MQPPSKDQIFLLVFLFFDLTHSCQWSPRQCGCWFNDSTQSLSERIIGGFESIPHAWPWMVSVHQRTSKQLFGSHICGIDSLTNIRNDFKIGSHLGATLINERYLLSAAHCFYETLVKKKESIDVFLFILGTHALTEPSHRSSLYLTASMIIVHEHYHPSRQINDIALIQLETNVDFHQIRFGHICLPVLTSIDVDHYPFDETWAVAIGWGRVFESADRGSTTLQQVLLQVEEGSQCDRIKSGRDINSQFCAGDLSTSLGRDTCQGDSGGPLMTRVENGLWVLVGLTSYGRGCGRRGELAVYTRVSVYLTWIDQSMKIFSNIFSKSIHRHDHIFVRSSCCYSMIHQLSLLIICILILFSH